MAFVTRDPQFDFITLLIETWMIGKKLPSSKNKNFNEFCRKLNEFLLTISGEFKGLE